MSKIGLGTVQFGLDYGVSNTLGKTPFREVEKIIEFARESNVLILDTAQMYGNAEKVLGKIGVGDFKIITKIQNYGNLEDSLDNLNLNSVYGLLAHNAVEVINSDTLWEKFVEYKRTGLVEKIGVSVYNAEQIDDIIEKYEVDLIQLPINIYDQRLIQSGHLSKLKERNIEIHARSVFLQGLLLIDAEMLPVHLEKLKKHHIKYCNFVKNNKLSFIQSALSFVNAIEELDYIICGVNNLSQLQELLAIELLKFDFSLFNVNDENIIDPSKW